jgi:hypothetical protein
VLRSILLMADLIARCDHDGVTGSIRLGSLFLTLPTRALIGQQIISSDG